MFKQLSLLVGIAITITNTTALALPNALTTSAVPPQIYIKFLLINNLVSNDELAVFMRDGNPEASEATKNELIIKLAERYAIIHQGFAENLAAQQEAQQYENATTGYMVMGMLGMPVIAGIIFALVSTHY